MSKRPSSPNRPALRLLLRRADQAAVAALVGFALVAMGVYLVGHWRGAGRLIEIDQAPPLAAQYLVDLNSAQWAELSQLPEIGETLGRRIVEARTSGGPFRSAEDLERRVPGIGPKTLEKIRPFLSLPPTATPIGKAPG